MDHKIVKVFCDKFRISLDDKIKTNTDFTFENLTIIFQDCYKSVFTDNDIRLTSPYSV